MPAGVCGGACFDNAVIGQYDNAAMVKYHCRIIFAFILLMMGNYRITILTYCRINLLLVSGRR